ncbi:MAG: ABC transporter permease [Bacillota bacterium]|uniref:ABC transporter permease n=1 Tax=Desulfurispora thermophila TaxID=265470 RepID=UPI000377A386|nr:ABC transporter permease [Desulfurispora thermophila]
MSVYLSGLKTALYLLFTGDPQVWQITLLTLKVSGLATAIAVLIGLPAGFALAMSQFPGRNALVSLVNFGMGLPPVVVGLFVWLLLARYGPLGMLGLLYTPTAMIIAQSIIAAPIVMGYATAAFQQLNPALRLQLLALGAGRWQLMLLLAREARLGLLAAVMAGFGGVVSEVGASMMVGGNIAGQTRVLTTATVLEVSKGQYEMAMAFSIILLLFSLTVTALLTQAQQARRQIL